jgi:hypothetical protein
LGIKFPVALSLISRRGRKTKNNGRVVSSVAWNYFGIFHDIKNILFNRRGLTPCELFIHRITS